MENLHAHKLDVKFESGKNLAGDDKSLNQILNGLL
jgi:hypothetical protein